MKFTRMYLAILIICFSLSSIAQDTDTKAQFINDSLNTAIQNRNNHDTTRINAFWTLSERYRYSDLLLWETYRYSDPEAFFSMLHEIKIIVEQEFRDASSDELKRYYNTILGEVISKFAEGYSLTGDNDKAADHFQKAITIFEAVNDQYNIIINLIMLGRMYRDQGELQKSLEIHKRDWVSGSLGIRQWLLCTWTILSLMCIRVDLPLSFRD